MAVLSKQLTADERRHRILQKLTARSPTGGKIPRNLDIYRMVEIKEAPDHGKGDGIFLRVDYRHGIRAGTEVALYNGDCHIGSVYMSKERLDYAVLCEATDGTRDQWWICAETNEIGSWTRLMNRPNKRNGETANVRFSSVQDPITLVWMVIVVAIRRIRPGEQLLAQYTIRRKK